MSAESAAGPGVTEQPANSAASAAATTTASTQANPEKTQSRLAAIAKIEGLDPEEMGLPKGEEHAEDQDEENAGADQPGHAGDRASVEQTGDRPRPEPTGAQKPQPESKVAEDDEPEITDEQKAELPEWVMPRIHKLTRQREELKEKAGKSAALETEVAQLREQVKAAPTIRVNPTADNPLADVSTADDLRAAHNHFESLLQFATLNPEGATDVEVLDPATGKVQLDKDGQPVTRDFSAKEIAQMRYNAEKMLREALPARAQYLQARQANDAQAREVYPEMFQKDTPENKIYTALRTAVPGIDNLTDPDMAVGSYIDGRKIHLAKQWLKHEGEVKPEAIAQLTDFLDSIAELSAQLKTKAGQGAGQVNGRKVSPEVQKFLRPTVPQAPKAPGTIGSGGGGREAATGKAGIEKAKERVLAGGGEEAEVDLVSRLRRSQRQAAGAALV